MPGGGSVSWGPEFRRAGRRGGRRETKSLVSKSQEEGGELGAEHGPLGVQAGLVRVPEGWGAGGRRETKSPSPPASEDAHDCLVVMPVGAKASCPHRWLEPDAKPLIWGRPGCPLCWNTQPDTKGQLGVVPFV